MIVSLFSGLSHVSHLHVQGTVGMPGGAGCSASPPCLLLPPTPTRLRVIIPRQVQKVVRWAVLQQRRAAVDPAAEQVGMSLSDASAACAARYVKVAMQTDLGTDCGTAYAMHASPVPDAGGDTLVPGQRRCTGHNVHAIDVSAEGQPSRLADKKFNATQLHHSCGAASEAL